MRSTFMTSPIAVTPAEGERYLLRPLCPTDRGLIERALTLLSERTLYSRFHGRGHRLSARDLDYLTKTDRTDHVAWLVIDPAVNQLQGVVALGRYVREAEVPSRAEVAMTVCDRHQGRGVSKVLLGALGASAMLAGIERFSGNLLPDNAAMQRLMRSLGADLTVENGLLRAEALADPWQLGDTANARRIRRVATQVRAALIN